jgi:transposase InsO family protein
VERFNESLKFEHLYREEIADALALAEQVEQFRAIYNDVRPHEALGYLTPMSVHLAEPNLLDPESVQKT